MSHNEINVVKLNDSFVIDLDSGNWPGDVGQRCHAGEIVKFSREWEIFPLAGLHIILSSNSFRPDFRLS